MKETFALATTCKHFSQDICEVQVFCHFCMIVSHLMQWTNTVVHPYIVGMDAKFCASSVLRIHLASCWNSRLTLKLVLSIWIVLCFWLLWFCVSAYKVRLLEQTHLYLNGAALCHLHRHKDLCEEHLYSLSLGVYNVYIYLWLSCRHSTYDQLRTSWNTELGSMQLTKKHVILAWTVISPTVESLDFLSDFLGCRCRHCRPLHLISSVIPFITNTLGGCFRKLL